jgi:hypothetical protein
MCAPAVAMLLKMPIPSYPDWSSKETFNDRTAGAACNAWVIVKGVTSLKINGFGISIDNKFLTLGNEDR